MNQDALWVNIESPLAYKVYLALSGYNHKVRIKMHYGPSVNYHHDDIELRLFHCNFNIVYNQNKDVLWVNIESPLGK